MAIHSITAVAAPKPIINVLWETPRPGTGPAATNLNNSRAWQPENPAPPTPLTGWTTEYLPLASPQPDTYAVILYPDPAAAPAPNLGWFTPGALVAFEFDFGLGLESTTCTVQPDLSGVSALGAQLDALNLNQLRASRPKGSVSGHLIDGAVEGARGVRDDLQDLLGYPLAIQSADGIGGYDGGGSGGPGGQALVDAEIRRALGRKPSADDVSGTLALLDRSMEKVEEDGVERWVVRPGGAYVTQADTGAGVTGRQASLASLARDTLEQIKPLVEKVEAVAPTNSNPGLLDVHREAFLSSLTNSVSEASVPGGPLKLKAEVLLDQCLSELARFGRQLRVLRRRGAAPNRLYSPTRRDVITTQDEDQFTTFLVILDRYVVFDDFYRDYLGNARVAGKTFDLTRLNADRDRGKRFTTLDRIVDVIADGVRELDIALASVGVDREERQAYVVRTDGGTLADLMDWADQFPDEARPLIASGGIAGVRLLPRRLRNLHAAFSTLQQKIGQPGANVPRELRQHRVRRAVEKLVRELDNARTAASTF